MFLDAGRDLSAASAGGAIRRECPPVPSCVKKILVVLGVIFLLILIGAGGVTALLMFGPNRVKQLVQGETRLLDYLGAQVVGIANSHLVPELSFETIRYDAPYTLALGGVRLTAADTTRVLDLGKMTVTLAETPRVGQPLQIASLKLSNGSINLIRDPGTGGLRGLSPIVEPAPVRERTAADKPEFSLANVLVLNKIVIEGIDLVYDPGDGAAPMRLDALAANLDIIPASDAGQGWYELKLVSGRKPGLQVDLDGRVNIDSFDLALNRVTANAELDEQTATTLPPQLSALIARYQLRGTMRATADGRVALLDPANAEVNLVASLDNGRGVFGEYQVPIDSLNVRAQMASGIVDLRAFEVSALGGSMAANGRMDLAGDASVEWTVAGMSLREMLASRPADQPPKMAGLITTTGRARFPMADPMGGLSGAGQLDVKEGRLVNIPVFSDLMRVMEVTGLTGGNKLNDSFSSPINLSPQGVRLDKFDFRTPAIAVRGSGMVGFDGGLDFSVNGGPLESIQNKLGKFGSILGKITDQFVTYRIRGSVSEPKVAVQPLGIGG